MSDQDTKPAEGIKPEVIKSEDIKPQDIKPEDIKSENNESEVKNTAANSSDSVTIPEVKPQEIVDAQGPSQDTAVVKVEGATEVDKAGEGDVNGDVNEDVKAEDSSKPKPMLRVKRGEPQVKSDPSTLADSDNARDIRRQVHFYFSDSNLPKDKFLWNKTDGTGNKPVPLTLICSFSRMRHYKPYSAVVEALKASDNLVVEGAEGEETVRRKDPYQESDGKAREIDERSVYIKGFGMENSSLQFDIEDWAAQFGEFNAVRLRRDPDDPKKNFKGSIFVEWTNKETADKFVSLDPKPLWKGHELLILRKVEYDQMPDGSYHNDRHRGQRGGGFGRGPRQLRGNRSGSDANDWKKRRDEDKRNGFNDSRGRRDNRGRGRSGGGHRGRGGDRTRHENGRTNQAQRDSRQIGPPKVNISKPSAKRSEETVENSDIKANGKRGRDEDASANEPPSKKVDTKETGTA